MSDYDLLARDNTSVALVAREEGRPRGYPAPTAPAASVEVFWRFADEPVETAKPVGVFAPGTAGFVEYSLDKDRSSVLMARAISPTGVRSVSQLADAQSAEVPFSRETDAPVIGQNAPATTEAVEIGITNFTRFARQRRVTISGAADMSDPLAVLVFDSTEYVVRELPRYLTLTREAGLLTTEAGSELLAEDGLTLEAETALSALPRTVYITVAHSGGNGWTPESNVLEVTFAAGDGTGGSAGDFDPRPRDLKNIDDLSV